MVNFLPNAGKGQKITTKFKSKVFSFGDVLVDHNELTLYQISEPLLSTSSATAADPAPYGTDINGKPLNDPIPDTEVDPATGEVVSSPATGTSVLLDKWTVQKPDITTSATATLSAPAKVQAGENLTYTLQIKTTQYPLAGTQVRFVLPAGVTYAGVLNNNTTLQGNVVVVSVGHLALGAEKTVSIPVSVPAGPERTLVAQATVTSSTALSVTSNKAGTRVIQ
jgi:hypothetical protein